MLPRGGRSLFPERRVVAFYGAAGTEALGVLGNGSPEEVWPRLAKQVEKYARGKRPVLPAYELIAVVASSKPGKDGLYRNRVDAKTISKYAKAARRHNALLILDIQPGQGDFLTEAKRLAPWLKKPHVALALDPEWNMGKGKRPGEEVGSVTAKEINRVSAWLDQLTAKHQLPEKMLLIHQFTADMIDHKKRLKKRPNLAITLNMDGFGAKGAKKSKYRMLARDDRFSLGFKLFYEQDVSMMRPKQVLHLDPPPSVIEYQ